MFVKICGVTREKDFELVAGTGADACGFIAWPGSKRFVTPERFREITTAASSKILLVAVFVNPTPDEAARYIDMGAGAVQLHGDEAPELAAALPKGVEVWKAARLAEFQDVERLAAFPADKFLLDSFHPTLMGGSGVTCDWDLAARAVARLQKPALLAGGINESNIEEAAARVRPFGIDASSGVEVSPGIKDEKLVLALVKKAKGLL